MSRRRIAAVALVVGGIALVAIAVGARRGRHARGPRGKPERITLAPAHATRAAGESQSFTATAHYHDGTTRNVTQSVRYGSSDAAIAQAPNAAGKRSRVEAVAPGTATISATDPVSGVASTAGGGDATLTVVGALERIELTPRSASRAVGQAQNFTATGFYAGGGTRNLTQQVVYASSDTRVAVAPNRDGGRSRVETLAPGTATISATHPASGISTSASGGDAVLTVYAPRAAPPGRPRATR